MSRPEGEASPAPDQGGFGIRATRLLAIETTCDETGAAVLEAPVGFPTVAPRALSNVVASQMELHDRFRGVVPEIAARAHVRQILPVIEEALRRAGIAAEELDAVAVATQPGLAGSLLVGLTAAKTMAWLLEKPLVAVNHLEGHLYAARLAYPEREAYPSVGLVVSGGHTSLYDCRGPLDARLLGGTIDDAAGEAFDKVASLLGLGFPGGPAIERAARGGNPKAFAFPRAFRNDPAIKFSFSGLKTAVLYTLRGAKGSGGNEGSPSISFEDPSAVADVAASFQAAVVDALTSKCLRALEVTGHGRLIVGGGVAANGAFRERLERECGIRGVELLIPPPSLCTDNAAMGAVAFHKLQAGILESLDLDATPGLVRPGKG